MFVSEWHFYTIYIIIGNKTMREMWEKHRGRFKFVTMRKWWAPRTGPGRTEVCGVQHRLKQVPGWTEVCEVQHRLKPGPGRTEVCGVQHRLKTRTMRLKKTCVWFVQAKINALQMLIWAFSVAGNETKSVKMVYMLLTSFWYLKGKTNR